MVLKIFKVRRLNKDPYFSRVPAILPAVCIDCYISLETSLKSSNCLAINVCETHEGGIKPQIVYMLQHVLFVLNIRDYSNT